LTARVQPSVATINGPTLEGEQLQSTSAQTSGTSQCDVNGTSTVHFSADGIAMGPFPGTFQASGTVTFGPQTVRAPLAVLPAGDVTSYDETFTIQSAAGDVTGTKSLYLGPIIGGEAGTCETVPPDVVGIGGSNYMQVVNVAQYQATIDGPLGTYTDSGLSFNSVAQIDTGVAFLSPPSFGELFVLSFSTASTPGRATGGGQIDHADLTGGITFAFTARSDTTGTRGACDVIDHATQQHVHCDTVDTYLETGNTATITGQGSVDGTPTNYRMAVADNAEPGIGADTFSISTDSGYTANGDLTQGNVQVHR
jgi:hypothetical protein